MLKDAFAYQKFCLNPPKRSCSYIALWRVMKNGQAEYPWRRDNVLYLLGSEVYSVLWGSKTGFLVTMPAQFFWDEIMNQKMGLVRPPVRLISYKYILVVYEWLS